jgi:hypothetical protein
MLFAFWYLTDKHALLNEWRNKAEHAVVHLRSWVTVSFRRKQQENSHFAPP